MSGEWTRSRRCSIAQVTTAATRGTITLDHPVIEVQSSWIQQCGDRTAPIEHGWTLRDCKMVIIEIRSSWIYRVAYLELTILFWTDLTSILQTKRHQGYAIDAAWLLKDWLNLKMNFKLKLKTFKTSHNQMINPWFWCCRIPYLNLSNFFIDSYKSLNPESIQRNLHGCWIVASWACHWSTLFSANIRCQWLVSILQPASSTSMFSTTSKQHECCEISVVKSAEMVIALMRSSSQ